MVHHVASRVGVAAVVSAARGEEGGRVGIGPSQGREGQGPMRRTACSNRSD
jgi:hypothetical protein